MCTASQRNPYLNLKEHFKGEFVKAHGVVPIARAVRVCSDHKLLREGQAAVWGVSSAWWPSTQQWWTRGTYGMR